MSAALRFEQVAVRLGGQPVLRGLDLEVEPGQMLALVGRNGAGKTTLLRLATRVLRPDSGAIHVAGRRVEEYARRELARRVAVVPQQTLVPFPFRAGEVVLMGRAPHLDLLGFESALDLELARQAMERFGIAHLADRSILELSGGERQLVMAARAVAQQADLLLLDEPTAFLDLRHRLEVLAAVRELADSGRSALVVSHDLGLAARFCDRIAMLSGGVVIAAGPPRAVLAPDRLRAGFGIEADVLSTPDGAPVIVPRRAAPEGDVG
jgi:iron complex transport system ATP-binding protein